MNQVIQERISESLLDWRDSESLALYESPWEEGEPAKGKYVGCRVAIAVQKRTSDLKDLLEQLSEMITKSVKEDWNAIDYLEIVRVKADTPEEETTVLEILEIQPKRKVGLW